MKIKQYGPRMEELKREGKTNKEIATEVGLKDEQVIGYFKRKRTEQRRKGYPRSRRGSEAWPGRGAGREVCVS